MTTISRVLIMAALAASLGTGGAWATQDTPTPQPRPLPPGVSPAGSGAPASGDTLDHGKVRAIVNEEIKQQNEEIDRLRKEALDAFANDNCVRLSVRRNQLGEMWRQMRDQASFNAFYAKHGLNSPTLVGFARPGLEAKRDKLEKVLVELNALRCPKVDPAQAGKTQVQVDGGVQFKWLPGRGFLGTELQGSGVPLLGLVTPDRTASGPTGSVSVKTTLSTQNVATSKDGAQSLADDTADAIIDGIIDDFFELVYGPVTETEAKRRETWVKANVSHAQASADQSFPEIDPGPNQRVLIPGPNGGASGISLGGNPANIVTDAHYSVDLKKTGVSFAFGQTVTQGDRSASLFIVGGYSYLRSEEDFSAQILGFGRNFAYQTNVDVDQVQLRAGAEMVQAFEMAFGMVQIGGRVEIGPDYSRGRGNDSLDFTGFPQSRQSLSESKVDVGGSAGVFVNILPNGSPVAFQATVSVGRETGLPVVSRNGTDPSSLGLEAGVVGTARLGVFGQF